MPIRAICITIALVFITTACCVDHGHRCQVRAVVPCFMCDISINKGLKQCGWYECGVNVLLGRLRVDDIGCFIIAIQIKGVGVVFVGCVSPP